LAEKGKLQPNDFNNVGAQWEPESDYEDYEPPSKPKITEPCPPPTQVTPEDLANFDQKGPEEVLGMLEQVRRQVRWEVLKEESREQIAWFSKTLRRRTALHAANTSSRTDHPAARPRSRATTSATGTVRPVPCAVLQNRVTRSRCLCSKTALVSSSASCGFAIS
jgi:hypothetical protein